MASVLSRIDCEWSRVSQVTAALPPQAHGFWLPVTVAVIVRPEVLALLSSLEDAGVRRAVLTNDLAAFHPPEWIERMSVLRRFDPLVDLSHVGFLKPDPEAFEHALKELGIPLEEAARVVFVDDQRRNVAGAMAVGMRGVWFDPTDVEGALARLRAEVGLSG